MTVAPFSMAVGMKECPSACKPLIATNTAPLIIFLESICISATSCWVVPTTSLKDTPNNIDCNDFINLNQFELVVL